MGEMVVLKDIFGREIKIGDFVYAHNASHTGSFTIGKRWLCLVVGEDLCFTSAPNYQDPKTSYEYTFTMDSCLLLGHLGDSLRHEEDELRSRLLDLYKVYYNKTMKGKSKLQLGVKE